MATRFLLRARARLGAATTLLGGGALGAAVITSPDPQATFKLYTTVPVRLFRYTVIAATIVFDYEYSLWGLPERSTERLSIKHEVHLRSANRLQELCLKNGGIYIKLGQHICQLVYLIPEEYVQTMRESMLNKCPVSSYDQVCEVIKKELGGTPDEIFDEFEHAPVASASLAQVHAARLQNGQTVAVQHTHLTDTAAADYATVEFIVNTLHWLFPSFDYRWLVDEIRESLPKELDFLVEAQNGEKRMANFRKLSPHIAHSVYAPVVYWNLSTSKLLTMEFIDAAQISDVRAIRTSAISSIKASKLTVIPDYYFLRAESTVLLDHGLYKELDFATRINYAALWKALVFSDAKSIKENSTKLGAGDDLYALFAGILTMRPWNRVIDQSVDHLLQGSALELFIIIGKISSEVLIEAKLSQKRSLLGGLIAWFERIFLEARFLGMQLAVKIIQVRKVLSF
ncbi:putative ABC1 protein [Drosera capensis]